MASQSLLPTLPRADRWYFCRWHRRSLPLWLDGFLDWGLILWICPATNKVSMLRFGRHIRLLGAPMEMRMSVENRDPLEGLDPEVAAALRADGNQVMGVAASYAWQDDPRRLAFSFARYKFVSKMMDGCEHVLE